MANRDEIVAYANALLGVERWPEFGPPGLQVTGATEVTTLACGVSSSRALFEAAVAAGAEMVIVHHGLFWRNEPLVIDERQRGRLETLFRGNTSLVAYHLALDAHPSLGNNAQLAARLDATPVGQFGTVGLACTVACQAIETFVTTVEHATGRPPLALRGGPTEITRVAIATGAAGYDLIQAAHEGFDVLVTGEPEEPNHHTAIELGIHLIAAGHHATERFGVQALAAHLAERFDLTWQYLEIENPV